MVIPFVDLRVQYESLKTEIDEALARVLSHSGFVLGREVEAFEERFAAYLGVRFCVGVSSGTAALHLALIALGVGAGAEVIVPANSFFATAEAVSIAGARPVLVDADPVSYTMAVNRVEAAITPRTKAIIPVHLYGQPADLDPLLEIAARRRLLVIEDAAQAHGARYKGRKVGSFGRAGCFSFYPGKNLGAFGEGGAVVTDDPEVARQVRLLRNHGSETKYQHELVGYNLRLEGIQAAVLAVKLQYLDEWNGRRRQHAARYADLLGDAGLRLPHAMAYAEHVYHLFVVQTELRDAQQAMLRQAGIETGIHYPVPIHLQPAYRELGHQRGDFPESERQADRVLSLPMFPELSDFQIQSVARVFQEQVVLERV
jgi:dTDP-4-amino-4,6-dideoxygalactose transaminase